MLGSSICMYLYNIHAWLPEKLKKGSESPAFVVNGYESQFEY